MTNISILKMVVVIVGLVMVLSLVGVVILLVVGKSVPDLFQIVIVSGLTGLLGLLAPSKEAQNPNN